MDFRYKNNFEKNIGVNSNLVIGKEPDFNPLVSIIMPVYNHPDYIEESLKSVIDQKCDFDYEIIVIDNNHSDYQKQNQSVVEQNKKDNLRYYVNEANIGGIGSENRGIELARGEFLTYCHDDDVFYEDTLQKLIDASKRIADKNVAIFGNYITINEDSKLISSKNEWSSRWLRNKKGYKVKLNDFLLQNHSNGCGTLYNRLRLLEVGGFSEEYIPCPDYALNIMYTKSYGAVAISEKTFKYRISSQSDSSTAYVFIPEANGRIKSMLLEELGYSYIKKLIFMLILRMQYSTTKYNLEKMWVKNKRGINIFPRSVVYVYRQLTTISKALRKDIYKNEHI